MDHLTIRLPGPLAARLAAAADSLGMTQAEVIRRACRAFRSGSVVPAQSDAGTTYGGTVIALKADTRILVAEVLREIGSDGFRGVLSAALELAQPRSVDAEALLAEVEIARQVADAEARLAEVQKRIEEVGR